VLAGAAAAAGLRPLGILCRQGEEGKMAHQVVNMKCPNCGAQVDTGQSACVYCKQPVVISTFNSVSLMPLPLVNKYASAYRQQLAENPDSQDLRYSVAFCYLKLKLYDKANEAFKKALEENFDNSEAFFYAAVSLLGGKKAFLAPRAVIDEIESYINAAIMIEPKGIYHYLLAYIKQDYYARKGFNTSPTWAQALAQAQGAGLSAFDVDQLWTLLAVPKPAEL
jgi:tetratricopeptide (TPR) repeat protein